MILDIPKHLQLRVSPRIYCYRVQDLADFMFGPRSGPEQHIPSYTLVQRRDGKGKITLDKREERDCCYSSTIECSQQQLFDTITLAAADFYSNITVHIAHEEKRGGMIFFPSDRFRVWITLQ